jgi:CHAD domain-containing protein
MAEPEAVPAAKTPLHRLPPERAARRLLAKQLKHAEAAGQRLALGEDPEALHDFRVALRRFRSLERAHRAWVEDALPKKLRKRLQELVGSTGPARDCEVQLQWLEAQRAGLRPNQRPGYQWLRRRLEDRQRQGYAAVRAALPIQFAGLSALLRAALTLPAAASPTSFAQASAAQLQPLLDALRGSFAAIAAADEMAPVHAARLLVKRARYLLEPLAPALPDGKDLVRQLGGLQELLGRMHDAEVLGHSLGEAAAEAGAARYRELVRQSLGEGVEAYGPSPPGRRGDERAGLSALAQRVRAQMQEGRGGLLAKIRAGEVAALLQRLELAAELLAGLPLPAEPAPRSRA